MGSWWEFTENNRYAEENITLTSQNILGVNDFSCLVLESTQTFPLLNLIPHLNCDDSDKNKEKRIVYQFDEAPVVIKKNGPKIVFIHVIAPHDPYVFDENCKETTREILKENQEYQNYSKQANCIDTNLENLINEILNKSPKPPVIILQSDEGAQFLNKELSSTDDWQIASNDLL